jgi:predicted phage gp36 major capsid-like protein
MVQRSLEERVDMLERRFELLEQLPERVTALESQIVQLRNEMRAEFSATRAEARLGDERVMQTLRDEIREGDEETRRFMRVLYEDLVRRIELLGERH